VNEREKERKKENFSFSSEGDFTARRANPSKWT
jgi:hypothetical protein